MEELVELSVTDAISQGDGILTDDNLKKALDNNIGAGKYEISGDATTGWTVGVNGKNFKIDSTGKTETITPTGPKFSDYTWTEINALAKEIAKDNTITNQTANVTKTIKGKEYTAKVGDEKNITIAGKDYIVRILGFNHDTLESGATAYGDSKITKAGISFEFKTLLPKAQMNSTNTNADGWGASLMRKNLNSTSAVSGMINLSDIESVIGSNIIKSVTKSYIKTYNDKDSVTQCNDKLWLLACSEIVNNGCVDGEYSYAKTSEGSQYKYYVDCDAIWSIGDANLIKCNAQSTSGYWWWLRSPASNIGSVFCFVSDSGSLTGYNAATSDAGVAPGFAI